MARDTASGLAELASAIARRRLKGLVDVYAERRAEVCWRLRAGRVVAREPLLSEGAAVRRDRRLVSSDGLDRSGLAELLGVQPRGLPAFSPPAFPAAPRLEDAVSRFPAAWRSVRWRWSWAAVLAGGTAALLRRPELAEVTFDDGHRALTVWPPAPSEDDAPRGLTPARARAGRARVLLAPAAAAVLVHELFGHPLEGDLLQNSASPWRGRQGHRVVSLPVSVTDDPSRLDLPGGFSADDEGVPAAPRRLVANGTLVGVLADRECAGTFGVDPGNARRSGVHTRPRPRVSNLVVRVAGALTEPPRSEAGIEVAGLASGTLEPASAAIVLHVRCAYQLRRGERQKVLEPFTLVGTVAALREGMLAAAEPALEVAEPGWCAKDGEVVPTGAVAPWLLISGLEVR